ncbi:MAG: hybrid sensor histidine kinase/response regulator [Candidatus Binatia bacterium]
MSPIDITELQRAKEMGERLAAIVDSSDDAIVTKTLEGIITSWNRGAERVFGYTAAEAVGQHISFILPEERRAEEDRVLARLRRGERVAHFETVRQAKDGRQINISLTVSPIKDAEGRVIGALNVSRDITDRKRAERALRAKTLRQDLLSEALEHLLSSRDPERIVRELFPKIAAHLAVDVYFNYMVNPEGDALALHSYAGVSDETAKEIQRLESGEGICRTVAQTRTPIVALDIQNSDYDKAALVRSFGIQAYVCNPLISGDRVLGTLSFGSRARARFDDDELVFIRILSRYVALASERAQVNNALKTLNAELEERVSRRTAELVDAIAQREKLNEQLLQAQKMESIGTLASGIAHDFNNILNLISSYAKVAQSNAGNPVKLLESMEVIQDTVKRGAAVVQQLLATGHKTAMKFELVRVHTVIERLQILVTETFPKTIAVSSLLDREVPLIMADPNQINQVLLNLCVNARDAMPNGGELRLATGTITGAELRGRFQDAIEQQYAWISVADTGLGMDDITKKRLFEPFFTTKEPGRGTGLGLSVAYGIIRNHGGFVSVASQPGAGTTVCIYLPLPKEKAAVDDVRQQAYEEAAGECLGAGETILFVDDEARQLRVMKNFLESEGYRVLVAADGAEAVEMYLRHKDEIAVVVLDLGLPKINGWQAFQKMKQEQPGVRAIVATGYLSPEIESQMAQREVSGVVMKPYQVDDLLAKRSNAIHRRQITAGVEFSAVKPASNG